MPREEIKFNRFELSVHLIEKLSEIRIWRAGQSVAKESKRTLRARADFKMAAVLQQGLKPDFDPWPSRHVNLLGWPTKSEHMQIANKLAQLSKLEMPPEALSPPQS